MAQLPLFPSPPARRPATPEQVCDPADRRTQPYRVPIYRVTLVRESSITAPTPRLRGAEQAAALLRQCLGAVDREYVQAVPRTHLASRAETASLWDGVWPVLY